MKNNNYSMNIFDWKNNLLFAINLALSLLLDSLFYVLTLLLDLFTNKIAIEVSNDDGLTAPELRYNVMITDRYYDYRNDIVDLSWASGYEWSEKWELRQRLNIFKFWC